MRVGVVGTGALGSHHSRVFAGLEGAKLTTVFDLDRAKAAAVGDVKEPWHVQPIELSTARPAGFVATLKRWFK